MKAFYKATRALAVLLMALLVASVIPSVLAEDQARAEAAVASSAAATEVKIAWPMMDFVFWNPMNIQMVEDWVSCFMIYSGLFTYGQDLEGPINDLATGWTQVVNGDGTMTTTITITSHAYWRNWEDPTSTTNPVTAYDVEYTFERIMANPGGTWDTYLNDVTDISVVDDTHLTITTSFAKATLVDDISGIPIIPQYVWQDIADNKFLSAIAPEDTVGCGAFYFHSMSTSSWWRFMKAPNYFGEIEYGRDIDYESVLFTMYSLASNGVIAMNSGLEDCLVLSGEANLYLNELGQGSSVPITKYAVNEPGIYDIAINAIPIVNRTATYGQGNPLLLDPIVRQAIYMTENKVAIDDNLLFGLPTVADSVLHPSYWKKTIENQLPYDPLAAKDLLLANGYEDSDADGYLEATTDAYPVVQGWANAGDVLSFRLHCPGTDPAYATMGQNWVSWARDAGIQMNFEVKSESYMINTEWFKADYDIWIWGWGWGPEPLSSLSVWLWSEMRPGGDNCQMPMGPTPGDYDAVWREAQKTLVKEDRKVLVDLLQQWVYESWCENPPIYYLGLYGITEQRFVGWGNWSQHPGLPPASGYQWLWYNLEPSTANQIPLFDTPLDPEYTVVVDTSTSFSVEFNDGDDDQVTVNWTWGDGSSVEQDIANAGTTADGETVTRAHTYTTVNPTGYTLMVTIWDGNQDHQVESTATVYVSSGTNAPPSFTSTVGSTPASPVYVDDVVTWTISASDADDTALKFTWDWGDGTSTVHDYTGLTPGTPVDETADHAWTADGVYDVTVSVWDLVADPAHNLTSAPVTYTVLLNGPPTAPNVVAINAIEGVWTTCTASSSDPDADTLRFTWVWDDGTTNRTNHASSPSTVTSTVKHMWDTAGSYLVTVYADDQTGELGHNVSTEITAIVQAAGTNVAPTALALDASPSPAAVTETVTFTASAEDGNEDALVFWIDFDDGSYASDTTAGGAGAQTVTFTHAYDAEGTYTVTVYVNDSYDMEVHNVSTSISLTVTANGPPVITLPATMTAQYNVTKKFVPTSVSDPDGDALEVSWDWGDGSAWTMGDPLDSYSASHEYSIVDTVTLTVYANDGNGHNISATSEVTVSEANYKPSLVSIVKDPSRSSYWTGTQVNFTVTVFDNEGDELTVTVGYVPAGSSTPVTQTETVTPTAQENMEVNVSFTFTAAGPYTVTANVTDGLDHSNPALDSKSTSVTIVTQETATPEDEGGGNIMLYAGVGIVAALIIIGLALLLMKRKKGGAKDEGAGGMEGMVPPQ